ncbi:MAG: hypothetical protein RIQ93_3245 [Verrucomicrobiota bacterium]
MLATGLCDAAARTLRLFVVGNSFSNNATHFLPDLAKAGGHELIMAKAEAGGCSFARHWAAVEASLINPLSAEARIYSGGKSLVQHMGSGAWDVITLQQYSLHSSDVATYRPAALNLHAHLKKLQPKAEIVMHQTWAYRADAAVFGLIGNGKSAANQRQMWEHSRAAYWEMAREMGTRVIPTGDAFWRVDSDPKWGFQVDKKFDAKTAVAPALPNQKNSLHVGYRWRAEKLNQDANHANVAGEYLGALVWYGFLFQESPEKLAFVPAGLTPEFAAHLRQVAWQTVQSVDGDNKKVAAGKMAATR